MEVKWSSDCHCKIIFSGGRIENTRPSSETETRKSARSGSSSTGHRPENYFPPLYSLSSILSHSNYYYYPQGLKMYIEMGRNIVREYLENLYFR